MESWYLFSLAALCLLGSQRFLYKVAAEKHCSSALTTAVFMATVTLLSGIAFFFSGAVLQNYPALLVLSLLNSSSFALATIAHIEALRHLPAVIIFPLTRLSLVVVILVSVLYFGEQLGSMQWLGVFTAAAVVLLLAKDARGSARPDGSLRAGLFCVLVCILCGAIASISSKLAAEAVTKTGFMALSYLFGTGFSLAIEKRWGKPQSNARRQASIVIGVAMGGLNFFGFYAFLVALENGPLSSIALMTGMHFAIAIILSVLLYRERLSFRRGISLGLTLLALFLLKQ